MERQQQAELLTHGTSIVDHFEKSRRQADLLKHKSILDAQLQEDQLRADEQEFQAMMAAREAKLKLQREQLRMQCALYKRCLDDPHGVALREWDEATEGWDVKELEPLIAQRIRFARKREAGEGVQYYWQC